MYIAKIRYFFRFFVFVVFYYYYLFYVHLQVFTRTIMYSIELI